jgi:hypothetical protein
VTRQYQGLSQKDPGYEDAPPPPPLFNVVRLKLIFYSNYCSYLLYCVSDSSPSTLSNIEMREGGLHVIFAIVIFRISLGTAPIPSPTPKKRLTTLPQICYGIAPRSMPIIVHVNSSIFLLSPANALTNSLKRR